VAQRSAIVTGAGGGIGRATALALAARGWRVVLGDVDAAALVEVAAKTGGAALPGDLTGDGAVAELVLAAGPSLAAVVHSAALFPRIALADTRVADFDRVVAVNLRAAVALTLAARGAMPHGGALVFLTSGSGLMTMAAEPFQRGFALYGASKAALDRWVAGVAGELWEKGIAACTITPGAFVATPGLARGGLAPPPGAVSIPVERVADAVVRLAEDRSGAFAGRRLSAADYGAEWS
jgi:3-oxoacyl-[acyl-carrier protein] reductase